MDSTETPAVPSPWLSRQTNKYPGTLSEGTQEKHKTFLPKQHWGGAGLSEQAINLKAIKCKKRPMLHERKKPNIHLYITQVHKK